jgi:drug/metabolite transporter (DMT)-like permease
VPGWLESPVHAGDGYPDPRMLTALFVLARIVANPVSNVFQKRLAQRAANPVFIIGATHALLTLAALPFLAGARPLELGAAFWANMVICAVLAVTGNVLLVYALRSSDLSILGPINAYKAVLSLALGVFLIGEVPTAFGLAGVLLILVGSYFVVDRAPDQSHGNAFMQFLRERGVQLRLAALAFSATEAVFLKRAVLHSSPVITFLFWSILGLPIAAAAIMLLLRGSVGQETLRLRHHWRTYLWLAITTGLMQLTTLLTFDRLQVGYSLALFQLSTLISVFLGYRYFQERSIRRRLFGSAVMVAGAALIVALGRRG